jgi:beta-mannanase
VQAGNVFFMFCPNHIDIGRYSAEDYWPGRDWVDVIGVDGYNQKWTADGKPQHRAEDIIAPMYRRLTALHPTAEFMVGEIGSAAHPNKSVWQEALYTSTRFPRLTQIAFFHERKSEDWRLDSDPDTLRINRQYLAPQALE